ncbi:MAG: RrF2 family transcriptional regulator [Pseudomonadota bacterium]
MKLTTKGRYAVQAMADIAAFGGDGPTPASEVAERQNIPSDYLDQIFGKLRRAGLVNSLRGASGGYELARAAGSIRISEIVAAVDVEIKTTACSKGGELGCQGMSARCLTHDLWDELGRQIEIFLNAISLEDVVERRVLGAASVNPPTAGSFAAAASDTIELAVAGETR